MATQAFLDHINGTNAPVKMTYITADQESEHRIRSGYKPVELYASLQPMPGEVGSICSFDMRVVGRIVVVEGS